MKPTLFLLAAGMGSRYGGLKQLDGLGPNGETIMDYSIYDAIQAGFGKIVWVIRKDFEEQFRTQILAKYEGVEREWRYYFDENGRCIERLSNAEEIGDGYSEKVAADEYLQVFNMLLNNNE